MNILIVSINGIPDTAFVSEVDPRKYSQKRMQGSIITITRVTLHDSDTIKKSNFLNRYASSPRLK